MDRDLRIKRRLFKALEEIKRLKEEKKEQVEEKKSLMTDIRILVQKKFSSNKACVKSKWRKHFERDEAFKKLWKEIQPGKDSGDRST